MADIRAIVKQDEWVRGVVSSPRMGANVGTVVTKPFELPDYFEWRQETFQPFFHLPLNDEPGSAVAKALAGPDGVHSGGVTLGEEGLQRPVGRYTSTGYGPYASGRNNGPNTIVGDTSTFSFVNRTWVFTISMWIRVGPFGRIWPVATSDATNINPGFTWEIFHNRLNFRMRTDSVQEICSYGGTTNGTDFQGRVIHLVARGDGERCVIFIDGQACGDQEVPPAFDGPSLLPLAIAGFGSDGEISGVIIDDRAWSDAEIKADYERGISAIELKKFRLDEQYIGTDEYSDLDGADLVAGYQFQYPEYAGEKILWQDAPPLVNPVVDVGQPVTHVKPIYGDITGVQLSTAVRPTWNGAGLEGLDSYLNIGNTEDFAFLHQVGGRILIELYVDPDDTNRYILCNTYQSGTQDGFFFAYEGNNDRFLFGVTGASSNRTSGPLNITEAGFYRFEVVFSEFELSFYRDGQLVSTGAGYTHLDGSNTNPSTLSLRVGASAFGLSGYPYTKSAVFVYSEGGGDG